MELNSNLIQVTYVKDTEGSFIPERAAGMASELAKHLSNISRVGYIRMMVEMSVIGVLYLLDCL